MPVIAIDGPAGSGKSTVARAVADRLGVGYLDTGAMYRSVAFAVLRQGLDPGDEQPVSHLAQVVEIVIADGVQVDGVDATMEIRGAEVSRAVSAVAANAGVRAEMRRRQRDWAERAGGGVVEGRDIGSVVFPDAELKVFLTASDEERARRRCHELAEGDYDAVAAELARRDSVDASRSDSPLTVAPGAVVIDTTGRSVDEVVDDIVQRAPAGMQAGRGRRA